MVDTTLADIPAFGLKGISKNGLKGISQNGLKGISQNLTHRVVNESCK